jgi:hypothetical protein
MIWVINQIYGRLRTLHLLLVIKPACIHRLAGDRRRPKVPKSPVLQKKQQQKEPTSDKQEQQQEDVSAEAQLEEGVQNFDGPGDTQDQQEQPDDEEDNGAGQAEEQQPAGKPARLEPHQVPTSGYFWDHDDRYAELAPEEAARLRWVSCKSNPMQLNCLLQFPTTCCLRLPLLSAEQQRRRRSQRHEVTQMANGGMICLIS